ncbi:hypothetical protein BKA65DRAFT_59127 [Rhexocercosporidium sp. MPI-PUGE-AT-0058]|nr:hypothetical protein BKA65DRAFT_59127 [Rhexocercosporidium sp. MPI-PUGE-AT-0058]
MRFSTSGLASKAIFLVTLTSQVDAFWRMPCRSRTGVARIDPLVTNGSVAEHVHAIHGSGAFGISAGYDELIASDCTSCEVSQDKSVYWHPALYFLGDDGKYTLVEQVGGMLAYYLLYPNAGNKSLSAFPAGFEMIAGDTNQRNFSYPVPDVEKSLWFGELAEQPFLRQAAVGFNCLNYAKTPEGSLYRHFLPDKAYLDANCADGVRFELMFPSCWNGRDRTSEDKKSHVAYPSQVMTGDCKPEFPVRLPSLFYETIWATNAFKGKNGKFILSNGDPTGYGYHGDFMMGWDEGFLQSAVDTCTNLSGKIEDCPLFDIQSESDFSSCELSLPPAIAKEEVASGLASIPGNPMIANGPAYAGGATAGGAMPSNNGGTTGTVVAPTLSYTPGVSLASSETYVPGGIFAAKVSSTSIPAASVSEPGFAAAGVADPVATPTPAPIPSPAQPTTLITTSAPVVPATATEDGAAFSTEYRTRSGAGGVTVDELVWVLDLVTVTDGGGALPSATTSGYETEGEKKKRHMHLHRRGGRF